MDMASTRSNLQGWIRNALKVNTSMLHLVTTQGMCNHSCAYSLGCELAERGRALTANALLHLEQPVFGSPLATDVACKGVCLTRAKAITFRAKVGPCMATFEDAMTMDQFRNVVLLPRLSLDFLSW